MTRVLTKTNAVLDRHDDASTATHVRFSYAADLAAGEAPTHAVDVERSDWHDMGEPDVITVTIEPGDLLNDEATQ